MEASIYFERKDGTQTRWVTLGPLPTLPLTRPSLLSKLPSRGLRGRQPDCEPLYVCSAGLRTEFNTRNVSTTRFSCLPAAIPRERLERTLWETFVTRFQSLTSRAEPEEAAYHRSPVRVVPSVLNPLLMAVASLPMPAVQARAMSATISAYSTRS